MKLKRRVPQKREAKHQKVHERTSATVDQVWSERDSPYARYHEILPSIGRTAKACKEKNVKVADTGQKLVKIMAKVVSLRSRCTLRNRLVFDIW